MVYVRREKKKSFGAGNARGGEWLYLPQFGGPAAVLRNRPILGPEGRCAVGRVLIAGCTGGSSDMEAIVERVGGHGGAQMYRKETVLHPVGGNLPPDVYRA